eukprot:7389463-Prymnesium_polylepis.1
MASCPTVRNAQSRPSTREPAGRARWFMVNEGSCSDVPAIEGGGPCRFLHGFRHGVRREEDPRTSPATRFIRRLAGAAIGTQKRTIAIEFSLRAQAGAPLPPWNGGRSISPPRATKRGCCTHGGHQQQNVQRRGECHACEGKDGPRQSHDRHGGHEREQRTAHRPDERDERHDERHRERIAAECKLHHVGIGSGLLLLFLAAALAARVRRRRRARAGRRHRRGAARRRLLARVLADRGIVIEE